MNMKDFIKKVMLYQLERRDNMLNVNDIITLKNNDDYIIVDKEVVNDNEYLLVDKVDRNEELLDSYQIVKISKINDKLIINTVSDEENEKLKVIFLKKLEKNIEV